MDLISDMLVNVVIIYQNIKLMEDINEFI